MVQASPEIPAAAARKAPVVLPDPATLPVGPVVDPVPVVLMVDPVDLPVVRVAVPVPARNKLDYTPDPVYDYNGFSVVTRP